MAAIQQTGALCRKSLEELYQVEQLQPQPEMWQAEQHLIRFNLWANDIGLFRDHPYSIDSRLRKNDLVKAIVQDILEVIINNARFSLEHSSNSWMNPEIHTEMLSPGTPLFDAISYSSKLNNTSLLGRIGEKIGEEALGTSAGPEISSGLFETEISDTEAAVNPPETVLDEVDKAQNRIFYGLSRLILLSRSMKLYQREDTEAVADRYEPRDTDGNFQLPEFVQHLEFTLEKSFPQLNHYMKARLRSTMKTRWRRLSYYVSKGNVDINSHPPPSASSATEEGSKKLSQGSRRDNVVGHKKRDQQRTHKMPARQLATSTVTPSLSRTIDSGFDPNIAQEESSLPTPPASPMSLAGTAGSGFPAPPHIRKPAIEFKCPLCGTLQGAAILDTKAWRLHVMHDIAPYVCLYEQCTAPETLYRTSEEWKTHMAQDHEQKIWKCGECLEEFESDASYKTHLLETHGLKADESVLSLLAQMNESQKPAALFNQCLICGSKETQEQTIELHIAEHLRQLALMSLPWNWTSILKSNVSDDTRANNSSVDRMNEFVEICKAEKPDVMIEPSIKPTARTATMTTDLRKQGRIDREDRVLDWRVDIDNGMPNDLIFWAIGDRVLVLSEPEDPSVYEIIGIDDFETPELEFDPSVSMYQLSTERGLPYEGADWVPYHLLSRPKTPRVKFSHANTRRRITVSEPLLDRKPQLLEMAEEYSFQPLPTAHSIRVLLLLPSGDENDQIHCNIKTANLKDANVTVSYEAMSYSWDTRHYSDYIRVNGYFLRVTMDVYQALRRLRKVKESRALWIDAICINMHDLIERSCQIEIMHLIFGMATTVLAWLGESTVSGERAMSAIKGADLDKYEAIGELDNVSILLFIAETRLFRRRWVVQEFALAKDIVLILGRHKLHWNDLVAHFKTAVREFDRIHAEYSGLNSADLDTAARYFGRLSSIAKTGLGTNQDRSSLEDLVVTFTDFEVTDHRDVVYALRNIARETVSPQPGDIMPLLPDYSKPALLVFADFVAWAIVSSTRLDILCRPWAPGLHGEVPSWIRANDNERRQNPLVCSYGQPNYNASLGPHASPRRNPMYSYSSKSDRIALNTVYADSMANLETSMHESGLEDNDDWKPGFITQSKRSRGKRRQSESSESNESPVSPNLRAGTAAASQRMASRKKYKSSHSPRNSDDPPKSYARLDEDGVSLYVRGVVLSTIEIASQPMSDIIPVDVITTLQAWITEAQSDVLTAGRGRDGESSAGLLYPESWKYCTDYLSRTRNTIAAFSQSSEWQSGLRISSFFDSATPEHVQGFLQRVRTVVHNRRLLSLRPVKSDPIAALGPYDAQVGDVVCVFFGCSMPCVVRPRDDSYRLVGEAYVQGYMNGEAIALHEEGAALRDHGIQEFRLV